jgi:hypothetical protein
MSESASIDLCKTAGVSPPASIAPPRLPESLAVIPSEIISDPDFASMPDRALVEYVGGRIVKFAMEIHPLVVEVHKRFMQKTKAGRKFVSYPFVSEQSACGEQ